MGLLSGAGCCGVGGDGRLVGGVLFLAGDVGGAGADIFFCAWLIKSSSLENRERFPKIKPLP